MIPQYNEMYNEVLQVLNKHHQLRVRDMVDEVSDVLHLTEDERNQKMENSHKTVIYHRLGWTKTYLTKAGLIRSVERGVYQITPQGENILSSHIHVDDDYLMQYEEVRQFVNRHNEQPENQTKPKESTPLENIDQSIKMISSRVSDELLDMIISKDPAFFEKLVLDLLDKMGYAYATALEEDTVNYCLHQAKENAKIIEEAEKEMIFEGSSFYPEMDNYNPALEKLSPKEKMAAAKAMEQGALQEYDQVSIDYCVLRTMEKTIAIANSKGLSLFHRKNGIAASVSTIAQQNGDVKTGSEDWRSNDWSAFSPKEIGRRAGQKAVSHLGAYSLESGEYKVLLENHVAAELLAVFAGVFYGENVQKGFKKLNSELVQWK